MINAILPLAIFTFTPTFRSNSKCRQIILTFLLLIRTLSLKETNYPQKVQVFTAFFSAKKILGKCNIDLRYFFQVESSFCFQLEIQSHSSIFLVFIIVLSSKDTKKNAEFSVIFTKNIFVLM